MDLSVFLILLFVTLNFVAECFNWNQFRVKLGLFIATLVITLPNIIFMVIDWWQSPHSKMALLVLNTFKPILRGETYRLFRWLKSVGMGLTFDDLNYLPISIPINTSDFFVTRDCFRACERTVGRNSRVIPEDDEEFQGTVLPCLFYTKCTAFVIHYESEVVLVHQLKFSRKLKDLWDDLTYEDFINHRTFKSNLIGWRAYNNADTRTAKLLALRLTKIIRTEMPILSKYESRREWYYFQAAPTLDYLNDDLVLIESNGETIAVG